ncbi:alpha-glycosyltransferase family 71 protein [Pelomyxa schiedti]|nr:alpha-glycosyltransferase family 71 protein [Pelomyxa schiedti]
MRGVVQMQSRDSNVLEEDDLCGDYMTQRIPRNEERSSDRCNLVRTEKLVSMAGDYPKTAGCSDDVVDVRIVPDAKEPSREVFRAGMNIRRTANGSETPPLLPPRYTGASSSSRHQGKECGSSHEHRHQGRVYHELSDSSDYDTDSPARYQKKSPGRGHCRLIQRLFSIKGCLVLSILGLCTIILVLAALDGHAVYRVLANIFPSLDPFQVERNRIQALCRAQLSDDISAKVPRLTKVPARVTAINPLRSQVIQRSPDQYYTDYAKAQFSSFTRERIEREARDWRAFFAIVKSLVRLPAPFAAGAGVSSRGIVLSCGGRYFPLCLGNLRLLVLVHRVCVPIEVWYAAEELSDIQKEDIMMLTKYGDIRLRSLNGIAEMYDRAIGGLQRGGTNVGHKGFHMKVMAILCSNFTNILYLDADNTPGRDPTYLFDTPEFINTGAIFWPDMYGISEESAVWQVMGVPFVDMWAQESGQLVVDKSRVWRQLLLVGFMNQRQDFYYSMVNGDKDTFLFSWIATQTPYHMIRWPPSPAGVINDYGEFCGNSFVQYDTTGQLLFIHAVGAKTPPHSELSRKWHVIKIYSAASSRMVYNWLGGCINAEDVGSTTTDPQTGVTSIQVRPGGDGALPIPAQVISFASVFGNLEEVLTRLQQVAFN